MNVVMNKDGNGQGMGRVEQYHTHTHIVDGYKILSIPIPMGMKLYPCPYPAGTVPVGYPMGRSNTTKVTHYFTFIDSIFGAKKRDFDLLNL
jgi:hypothetical protein